MKLLIKAIEVLIKPMKQTRPETPKTILLVGNSMQIA
jgi:hypothetical protein